MKILIHRRGSARRPGDAGRPGDEAAPRPDRLRMRREAAGSRLEREISTIFDRLFAPAHPFRPVAETAWHPFTDIYEGPDHFLVRMELAGVDPRRLEVVKDGRCLIVRGERPEPPWGDHVACHQLEISYGPFQRVICLPIEFREDRVRVEYGVTGFLHVFIAKD